MRGQGMIGGMMALLVGLILLIAVLIPVVTQVVSDASFSGTNKTIADLFPMFLLLAGLLMIVGLFYTRK